MNTVLIKEKNLKDGTMKERSSMLKDVFAMRFRALRIEKGYTQLHLAQVLHVSRSCICAWEHATRIPDFHLLIEICNLLEVSCDYIMGLSGRKTLRTNTSDLIKSNKATFLDVSKLNEENLYHLVNIYNDLLLQQFEEAQKPA